MKILNARIPQEYLALKINYCRQQLEKLPKVKLQIHNESGVPSMKLIVGDHRYRPGSEAGKEYYKNWLIRDPLERELQLCESIWHCYYKGSPFPECEPHKVVRTLFTDTGKQVILNKEYFDSLKNDADTKHPKPLDYKFDGIYYRSAAEREIAMFYTEMGIPFKYEPEVMIRGVNGFIYPDFVPYFKEIDNCKFHEHFGIKNSANYLRITGIKYTNYTNAGLVPELDILFTHDVEGMPFDIRYLSSKLNTAIYSAVISTR